MRNALLFVFFVTTVVLGFFIARSKLRLSLEGLEGRTAKITRGDLTLPINATGQIKPLRRVEIKSEASGEVIEIHKFAGDRVRTGDLLIRLDRDEEQRNVNRAELDLEIAEARLEDAQVRLKQAQTVDLNTAQSKLTQVRESLRYQKFRLEKLADLPEEQKNTEEVIQIETSYLSQKAQLEAAQADVERAKLNIERVTQEVRQAKASHETVRNNLADAKRRLSKTDIISPMDGIVGDVNVQIGEVIQGGKTTLTGGTVLAVVLDLDTLTVKAEIDESDIGRILQIAPEWAKPGNEGTAQRPDDLTKSVEHSTYHPTITVESFRDRTFDGIIDRIYPEPETSTGVITYDVDVIITAEDHSMLLPNMRTDVRFTSEHVENAVLCPNEAIHEGASGGYGVYTPKPGGDPKLRETQFVACRFGLDNGNYSEVLCNELKEGMVVYTKLPAKRDQDKK